jgi:hypothetical protein
MRSCSASSARTRANAGRTDSLTSRSAAASAAARSSDENPSIALARPSREVTSTLALASGARNRSMPSMVACRMNLGAIVPLAARAFATSMPSSRTGAILPRRAK